MFSFLQQKLAKKDGTDFYREQDIITLQNFYRIQKDQLAESGYATYLIPYIMLSISEVGSGRKSNYRSRLNLSWDDGETGLVYKELVIGGLNT